MHRTKAGRMCFQGAQQTVHLGPVHIIFNHMDGKNQKESFVFPGSLYQSGEPASHKSQMIHNWLLTVQRQNSWKFPVSLHVHRFSRCSLMPVLAQSVLPHPPLALGFVFVQQLWRRHGWHLELASWFVVLPGVPLALAGGNHSDFVRSSAAILALKLYALGACLVVDAPPVLVAAPATPELPAIGTTDPVFKHLSWETLARTNQLLYGVDAGAVAIRNILSGPQLSASDLTPFCAQTQGVRNDRQKRSWNKLNYITQAGLQLPVSMQWWKCNVRARNTLLIFKDKAL